MAEAAYFWDVSATLTNSILNKLPWLKSPVVVNGTVIDVPTHKVDVVNELVVTVGIRTFTVAVAGLPGKPTPQLFFTVMIWYVVLARGSTERVVSVRFTTPEIPSVRV